MSDTRKLYIAGMGMITSVGANTAMTVASVNAGISAYAVSNFCGQDNESITLASVPNSAFLKIDADIEKGSLFNVRHDRVIKMAIQAIREACAQQTTHQRIPLALAMPQEQSDDNGLAPFIPALEKNCQPWISAALTHRICSGRAAGIDAVDFAFREFFDLPNDFMLIGGSDSYRDDERLIPLSKAKRLLVENSPDGFVPGEAAGFLLLTRKPELALARNGHIVALHRPGMAEESGHLSSEEPYRGEGLDAAFKQALCNQSPATIHSIYSSMNGEHHWAKEYGVAFIRNQAFFQDPVRTEHPADCYGDVGAATGSILIALAAEHLFSHASANAHLVYGSSDLSRRGAVVVEKMAVTTSGASSHVPSNFNKIEGDGIWH